jgi:hypothetical protein
MFFVYILRLYPTFIVYFVCLFYSIIILMDIYQVIFIVLVLCMILIFLVTPYTTCRSTPSTTPQLIEEGTVREINPITSGVPATVALPNRFRYHQPYYHRMMVNYPYYDPYYDIPLPNRNYCMRYPGCKPCPNWQWMQSSICPYTR